MFAGHRLVVLLGMSVCIWLPSATEGQKGGPEKKADAADKEAADKQTVRMDQYGDPLPSGAIGRLGTVRLRHAGRVTSVAFSPNGKVIGSAGEDNAIRLWDSKTGKQLLSINVPRGAKSISFSSDSTVLASGGWDSHVYLWDVATGREVRKLAGHSHYPVNCVVFSKDGATLASACGRGEAILWDPLTGKERRRVNHQGNVPCVVFSPDGKVFATVSHDRTIAFWDVTTGKELRRLRNQYGFLSVSFASHGQTVVTLSAAGTLNLWETATGKEVAKVDARPGCLVFSPDDKLLAASTIEHSLIVYDVETRRVKWSLKGGAPFVAPAFSPNGRSLVAAKGPRVIVCDTTTGKELFHDDPETASIDHIAFSPKSNLLGISAGSKVTVWDIDSLKRVNTIDDIGSVGSGVFWFSFDGTSLFKVNGRSLLSWNMANRKPQSEIRLGSDVYGGTFSRDGRMFAAISDLRVGVWEVEKGAELHSFKAHDNNRVSDLTFSRDGRLLATVGEDSAVRLWNLATGKLAGETYIKIAGSGGRASRVAFLPDGQTLVLGGSSRGLHFCNVNIGTRIVISKDSSGLSSVSPDGRILATTDQLGNIELWEVASGRKVRTFASNHSPILLTFSSDGRTLASLGRDATVLLWRTFGLEGWTPALKPVGDARNPAILNGLWGDLAAEDAVTAFQAVCHLVGCQHVAVDSLKECLKPAGPSRAAKIEQLIKELDDEDFSIRQSSFVALNKLGAQAETQLRQALEGTLSAEARRRAETLISGLPWFRLTTEELRQVRSIQVLEMIGTRQARLILASLAKGESRARQTVEASTTLLRLKNATAPDE